MLRECRTHGYFRGPSCPQCSEEGKFLMDEAEINRVGRIMAGVLRHFPEKFGLEMDEHGWVSLEEFAHRIRTSRAGLRWVRPHHLVAIALTDPKGRYQVDSGRIRATYGHSLKLDLDLPTTDIPPKLYYPVSEEEVEVVLERGIFPTDRQKVHLSGSYEAAMAAGLRKIENPVILVVDALRAQADGMVIQQAGTTVFITDKVPPEYLSRD